MPNLTKTPERLTGEVERRTPEDLRDIAWKMVAGQIFDARSADDVEFAFGVVLAFMPPMSKRYRESIGLIFEELSARRTNYGINGRPMFFSMQTIHVDDMPILQGYIDAFWAAKNGVPT
jgi:hypothetical protein